jgi:hypothetical protein
MMCNVLKNYHVMMGIDLHDGLMPPLAVPAKNLPYGVVAPLKLGPWGAITGKSRTDVCHSGFGETLIRGTDIGPLIPHIGVPQYLLPLIILTSASKSEFGASSVMTPDGPVAIACLVVANLNLNCMGPTCPPLPFGIVPAVATTTAGVTAMDLLCGALTLIFDAAVQYGLNRLLNSSGASRFVNWITRGLGQRVAAAGLELAVTSLDSHLAQFLGRGMIEQAIPTLIGLLIGSPLGYSIPSVNTGQVDAEGQPVLSSPGGIVYDGVGNYLNNPSVPPVGDYPTPTGDPVA